ncbi:hypothetical protein CL6EHI_119730 [Entamoeba histolytica]|uniref:Uncharacterized protein n=3 Tax=Entamoeba histolytica TaxID=5759 RepID=C4MAF1_ENTH1|nr:hypothetical protein EHI_119730 [Entamoeba histolytica HM-1:IMSS]EAL43961.1 hypothetical protein EHI_119730 [Entamoeba histolytica HM-1:IMSS]GAT98766.1 hypothetical protein CL6EHI_119730 [Entamoeba histolytica]|eukprot:XP_649348.1 hypothetical protein EHI_119730 [Entamoeba histolytica HM-1:IMSS]
MNTEVSIKDLINTCNILQMNQYDIVLEKETITLKDIPSLLVINRIKLTGINPDNDEKQIQINEQPTNHIIITSEKGNTQTWQSLNIPTSTVTFLTMEDDDEHEIMITEGSGILYVVMSFDLKTHTIHFGAYENQWFNITPQKNIIIFPYRLNYNDSTKRLTLTLESGGREQNSNQQFIEIDLEINGGISAVSPGLFDEIWNKYFNKEV